MAKVFAELANGFQQPGQPQAPNALINDLTSVSFTTKGATASASRS